MYLMSQYTDTQSYSRVSHNQEVTISSRVSNLTTWSIDHPDPKARFEMEGEPVDTKLPVLIRHTHTAQWLAADNIPYKTLYGNEMEVFTKTFQTLGKTQNLAAE